MEVESMMEPDRLATAITEDWITKDMLRQGWKSDQDEIKRYLYATDTSMTANAANPWKNKTTIPKLCQIRDNLYANYVATMFPQRKWLIYEGNNKESNDIDKVQAITNYMAWVITQPSFKHEMDKIILDYIDFGNCFATVEWMDERVTQPDKTQSGYVGPAIRRINPMDIVMNPTAENFVNSPKIVRSFTSLGELKDLLERLSNDENRVEYEELYQYLKDLRRNVTTFQGDLTERDGVYQMDGFSSFRDYLMSNMVEVLTFYGDIYDSDEDVFLKNHVITVVDRHKLIGKKPNPSFFGYPPIVHVPWRKRQDNLWGMSPFSNLVGMQYRMDHVENLKADVFDFVTFPVQLVKGYVEDFEWYPGAKIFMGDEGSVEIIAPEVQALQANFEIDKYEMRMEAMAGAPREALGIRSPGEKTKYEIQALENASSRLYQNKIKQFEEQIVEPLLNFMLELARRNLTGSTVIKVFDNDYRVATFQNLTVQDITGIGRIKPIAARHFAEQAELIQNLTNLTSSGLWPTVQPHFSSVKLARILEDVFSLQDYEVVTPFIALAEQADAQKQAQVLQEQVLREMGTATGMGSDFDLGPNTPQISDPQALQQGLAP